MATQIQRLVRGRIGRVVAKTRLDDHRLENARNVAEEAEMDLASANAALKRATQRRDGQAMLAMQHEVNLASKRYEEAMEHVKEATSIKTVREQMASSKVGLLKLIKVKDKVRDARKKLLGTCSYMIDPIVC
jgi:hypothetical protein